jgi:hypothetical protein
MILRLLNWQGIAGLGASLALALLLVIQWGEARHWKKQSASFEQSYQKEQAAFAVTVAGYRQAAAAAEAADRANLTRVAAEQTSINQRSENALQSRLAAARAHAEQLRVQPETPADPGSRPGAPVPGLPAASGGPDQAAREDRLPLADRELATEQAIQLDELIKWVRQQHSVDPNGAAGAQRGTPPVDSEQP